MTTPTTAARGGNDAAGPDETCALDRYQDVLWTVPVEAGGTRRRFLLDSVDFARDVLRVGAAADGASLAPVRARPFRQIPSVSLVVLLAVRAPGEDLWFELDNSNVGPILLAPGTATRLGLGPSDADAEIEVRGLDPFRAPVRVRPLLYDGNLGRTFADGRTFAFDLRAGDVRVGPRRAGPRGPS